MLRIAKSEARKYFSDVVTRAGRNGERVKITHYGKTLAVLISPRELASLDDCEREKRSRRSGKDGRQADGVKDGVKDGLRDGVGRASRRPPPAVKAAARRR